MAPKAHFVPVAVVGIACFYPGAPDAARLWENILARRRQFRRIPDARMPLSDYFHRDPSKPDMTYGKKAAVIDGFQFDWAGRRVPFSTYETTDISHWLALETALSAIADAGFDRDSIPGERTGVIVGNSLTGEQTRANTMRLRWPFVRRAFRSAALSTDLPPERVSQIEAKLETFYKSVFPEVNEDTLAGCLSNTIAGRICNFLNLLGGGYTVDGACSSSLLAISTGASGLAHGDLDLALAGGVDISLDPFELVGFSKTGALTAKDMTVYDRGGSGFIPGEGCGFVVLKRLEDARRDGNYIYAVIRGWGISSDGRGAGITAPSAQGQAKALQTAYARGETDMARLAFLEGHGTGTTVGDRVELEGIAMAMGPLASQIDGPLRSCAVTSLKSILGHCKAAAGVGGFLKSVMAVNQRVVPPTAACRDPHPVFDTKACRLYPAKFGEVLRPEDTVTAGVSAMGFGGINCHVVLESGDAPCERIRPSISEKQLMVSNQESELFLISADSADSLKSKLQDLATVAGDISIAEMADLASKLAAEAEIDAPVRCALIARDPEDLTERLEKAMQMAAENYPEQSKFVYDPARKIWIADRVDRKRVGVLYPGQGSQKINMARVLAERFVWAEDIVEKADAAATEEVDGPVSPMIFLPSHRALSPETTDGWEKKLSLTQYSQPAICMASVLWDRFFADLGLIPSAVGGHSLGELTAFHRAGALDEGELFRLAALRGRAMASQGLESGAMVSLRCSVPDAEKVVDEIDGYLVIANINAPQQTVISGETTAIQEAVKAAARRGIQARRLPVSNAFHSRLASGAARILETTPFLNRSAESFSTKLFSSSTGKQVPPGTPLNEHFSRQVMAKVDFVSMVEAMAEECDIFLEIGPGRVLTGLVNHILEDREILCFPVESAAFQDEDLNRAAAALFIHGVELRWEKLYDGRLVREFVPPSERIFVENQCERPFKTDRQMQTATTSSDADDPGAIGLLDRHLFDLIDIPQEDLLEYLKNRGPFLSRVIQADLRYPVGKAIVLEEETNAEAEPVGKGTCRPAKQEAVHVSIDDEVLSQVEKITGFSKESLSTDMRLLDDLNLDSIKAGDLMVKISKILDLPSPIEPLDYANASLSDVIEAFEKATSAEEGAGELGAEFPDAFETIMEQASELTGYPVETLDADALVEMDLGIGPDKLRNLIEISTRLLRIDSHLDLEPLRERSLRQIASILERLAKEQVRPEVWESAEELAAFGTKGLLSWVRDFKVELVDAPFPPLPEWWGKRKEDDWVQTCALIVCEPESSDIADALRDSMLAKGARARVALYEEARENHLSDDPSYSHLLAVLPGQPGPWESPEDYVRQMVERLAAINSPPPASKAPRRRTTIAYIQFGGGAFGTQAPFHNPNQCCAAAMAKSVHLERDDLRVRVLDFSRGLDPEKLAEIVLSEINTPTPFAALGFDFELNRKEARMSVAEPVDYTPRNIEWSSGDVMVVTGGARGITAAIAFELARRTGVRMALLGSSEHPGKKSGGEISKTLKKYSDSGLVAEYFSCDVRDSQAVREAVEKITATMGAVTGVVHGAGLNRPRPASHVSIPDAIEEVSPKLLGVLNLMGALENAPLKMFAGLSSIIGSTGMPGNAWYGFSNEVLEILLGRLSAQRPEVATVSVGYSIWRDVGMGHKMGSVERLQKSGIDAIPTQEGVERFVNLFLNDPGTDRILVTARLGPSDTLASESSPGPENARFLEKLLLTTPGVESVFGAHLSMDRDLYLEDHVYNGSFLFPTVFGLEAMAQAAAQTAGLTRLDGVRIRNIDLKRPVTVDPEYGADIVIQAVAQERGQKGAPRVVRAGIFKQGAGHDAPFFSAEFVLAPPDIPAAYEIPRTDTPSDIVPELDLYRPNLLFQGPRFHRIEKILSLEERAEGEEDEASKVVFETANFDPDSNGAQAFSDSGNSLLMLGDPFFRDSLLQSAQMLVPTLSCLPVFIENIDIFPVTGGGRETLTGESLLIRRERTETEASVTVFDENGAVRETIRGYVLHILRHLEGNPLPSDLIDSQVRDNAIIAEKLQTAAETFKIDVPEARIEYLAGLHQMSADQRHRLEVPLILKTAEKALGKNAKAEGIDVDWLETGKPVLRGPSCDSAGVSISHDDRLCLCAAAEGPQGCDVVAVEPRDRETWVGLVGKQHEKLVDLLVDGGDGLDCAGSRVWAVMETAKKSSGHVPAHIEIQKRNDGAILFSADLAGKTLSVLTFASTLTRGPERLFSFATKDREEAAESPEARFQASFEELFSVKTFATAEAFGPQGQGVFFYRFPVTFKANAQLSRKVYFSNYFYWLGKVREIGVWPILGKVAEQFATGKWGLVTNKTRIRILGEASALDHVEARLWIHGARGPKNPIMDMTFEYRKMLKNGGYERLAWCEQQATWVKILDHGVVEPEPYPDYYWEFMDTMLPKYDAPNTPEPLPESLAPLYELQGDEQRYAAPPKPVVEPLVFENRIATSLDNSNIVGNLYFANYYAWQGQVRDRFFYQIVPEYFRGVGEKGELICLESQVQHLREAMPFDDIIVTMALKKLQKFSAVFYFEYFRAMPDGGRLKLAFGEHRCMWVLRDETGDPIPAEFPAPVMDRFREAVSKVEKPKF